MRKRVIRSVLFLLLMLCLIAIYPWLDAQVTKTLEEPRETANVSRVVDGDTLKLSTGENVRLLGINTPEKGEKYYAEAQAFLKMHVEGKQVLLEKTTEDRDKYNRLLRHIFLGEKHVNKELIEQGYANPYFLGDTKYKSAFREAWEHCVQSNVRLCKKSLNVCAPCIQLKEFNSEKQYFVLKSVCSERCDLSNWVVKEEGRKKFSLGNFALSSGGEVKIICGKGSNSPVKIFLDDCEQLWTATGDTLYLRDNEEKLVLWESY